MVNRSLRTEKGKMKALAIKHKTHKKCQKLASFKGWWYAEETVETTNKKLWLRNTANAKTFVHINSTHHKTKYHMRHKGGEQTALEWVGDAHPPILPILSLS